MTERTTGWARWRGTSILALALTAVMALASACGGGGGEAPAEPNGPVVAVQDDQLPVVALEGVEARLDLIAETGTTTTRVDLFWLEMAPERPQNPRDPSDPAYDWRRADAILTGLAERGITPIVSVYSSPPWAVDGVLAGDPVNPAAPRAEDYADFMAAIAARYDGTFAGPEGEPLPEVTHWELWNEPNLVRFLSRPDRDDPESVIERYARMVSAAYPAIKEANPEATVIAGVSGPVGSTGANSVGAVQWIRGLAEREVPMDAYSQHIYPAAAPTLETVALPSWSTLDVILTEIEAIAPGLPLYITEAGYTTEPTEFRDRGATVTLQEQAEYLTQIWDIPVTQDPRVRAIVWFNLQDNEDWPAGLLQEDGSRKPSYAAFTQTVEASRGATIAG